MGNQPVDYGSSCICYLDRNFSLTFKRFLFLLFSCPCISGQLLLFRLCWLNKLVLFISVMAIAVFFFKVLFVKVSFKAQKGVENSATALCA